jgi:signal peptidase II
MDQHAYTTTWKDWAILLGVALFTIIVDQITKGIVVQSLNYSETWEPIPALSGIFDITYTRNTGAAFGMARDFGGIFLIIAIVVVGAILYYYRTLPEGVTLIRVALGLQMGGAVGNAVDRVTRGFVVDFFHLHGWPIFNIADSSIVVGVGVLIITMWWYERQQEQSSSDDPSFGLGELRDDRES